MIVVGAYPDAVPIARREGGSRIATVGEFVDELFPESVACHLLPFYPASGDGGFAIDDCSMVRPGLGHWSDVGKIALKRPLIVDGVFNHVGMGHKWLKKFWEHPDRFADVLQAYRGCRQSDGPRSPRGDYVLRPYDIEGEQWFLWQTFSAAAVDVRLDSSEVLEAVDHYLTKLRQLGIWGVRLDAVAYYAKFLGAQIRHNPGANEIAVQLATMEEARGMHVLAQLDCDDRGLQYFRENHQKRYVLNDFSYSAILLLSILSGSAEPIARHLVATEAIDRPIVRAPRNHDGILLRSGLLDPTDISSLLRHCNDAGIEVRSVDGVPYEINASAPFIFELAAGGDAYFNLIEMVIAVSLMADPWVYLYLPFVVGHRPEAEEWAESGDDPRADNRRPISRESLERFLGSGRGRRVSELVSTISRRRGDQRAVARSNGALLELVIPSDRLRLVANVSAHSQVIGRTATETILTQSQLNRDQIGPWGYGIWVTGNGNEYSAVRPKD